MIQSGSSLLRFLPWALIIVAGLVWLVGGNLLLVSHYRRLGERPWSRLRHFVFPVAGFNAREWVILAVVAGLSLAIARAAMLSFALLRGPS